MDDIKQIITSNLYIFHCVRSDLTLHSIFENGLRSGTNVSLTKDGQAFEDEGGTILVFNRSDYQLKLKDYQFDGIIISGYGKPVAIIKDTSLAVRDGFTADELSDQWDNINSQFEKLALEVGKTNDELHSYSYKMKSKGVTSPDWITPAQWVVLRNLRSDEDKLFSKLDVLGERDEIKSVAVEDVLQRYKMYNVPVLDLPEKLLHHD